jgi:hypothetical protein
MSSFTTKKEARVENIVTALVFIVSLGVIAYLWVSDAGGQDDGCTEQEYAENYCGVGPDEFDSPPRGY